MKRKINKRWSIPPISTKFPNISHLKSMRTNRRMQTEIQVLALDKHNSIEGIKPVNGIPTHFSLRTIVNANYKLVY